MSLALPVLFPGFDPSGPVTRGGAPAGWVAGPRVTARRGDEVVLGVTLTMGLQSRISARECVVCAAAAMTAGCFAGRPVVAPSPSSQLDAAVFPAVVNWLQGDGIEARGELRINPRPLGPEELGSSAVLPNPAQLPTILAARSRELGVRDLPREADDQAPGMCPGKFLPLADPDEQQARIRLGRPGCPRHSIVYARIGLPEAFPGTERMGLADSASVSVIVTGATPWGASTVRYLLTVGPGSGSWRVLGSRAMEIVE